MFFAKNKSLSFSILISTVLLLAACPAPTTNVNTNSNTNLSTNTNTNVNINSNPTTNVTTPTGSTIDTKEPDQYTAVVKMTIETTGDQKLTIPTVPQATVAKSGANRRMEFNSPTGDKLVYLETGGKTLVIVPNRKQYAELDKASTGIDIRSMMTPDQIINQVKNLKGVERVGEEKYAGRDAVKYQYSAVTDTKSTAGQVETKSFIFVDKETSLPLHSETNSVSSASYQGIQGLKIITDITDIKTTVDSALFAEPTDFAKVQPEQVKQQMDLLFRAVAVIIEQIMKQAQPVSSPAATKAP